MEKDVITCKILDKNKLKKNAKKNQIEGCAHFTWWKKVRLKVRRKQGKSIFVKKKAKVKAGSFRARAHHACAKCAKLKKVGLWKLFVLKNSG